MKKIFKVMACSVLFFVGAGVVYVVLDNNHFFKNGSKKRSSLDVEDLDDEYEEDWLDDDWLDDDDDLPEEEPDKEEDATE